MSVRRALLTLFLLVPPVASGGAKHQRDPAEEAYQGARRYYYALKDDPARRKFRHNWQNVAGRFEQVAAKFPKSSRATDALFTAAQMREELSRISMLDEDLDAAIADYQKLLDQHPRDRLADDAAYALGKIEAEHRDNPDAARKVLSRGLEQNPHADRAKAIKALLASLGEKTPRPVAKPVVIHITPLKSDDDRAEVAERPARTEAHKTEGTKADSTDAVADRSTRSDARRPARDSDRAEKDGAKDAVASRSNAAKDVAKGSGRSEKVDASGDHDASRGSRALADAISRAAAPSASSAPAEDHDSTSGSSDDQDGADDSSAEDVQEQAPVATSGHGQESRPAARVTAAEAKARLRNAKPKSGEITLAEQLGLKVRRVVIDAGHGGHDSGALGPGGTMEKDVALAIAKKVGNILAASGLEVMLTRDDDTFVRLEDRAKIANEAKGDLFISIHCNSAQSKKLRGIETYTLNTSSDRYSIRLAARENSSSEKGISDLQFILADLATKANTEESTRLATRVQHSLVSALGGRYKGVKDLGTKEALFYVLLGAKMPSILVETSFISNPEDEKRLGSKTYQEDVAQAIAGGVQEFLGNRQRVAKVD